MFLFFLDGEFASLLLLLLLLVVVFLFLFTGDLTLGTVQYLERFVAGFKAPACPLDLTGNAQETQHCKYFVCRFAWRLGGLFRSLLLL